MLVASSAFAAGVVLEGPDELVGRMTPYLPEEAPAPKRLQAMLEEMLATEGHFSPSFTVSEAEGVRRVRFDPGPRTCVAEVTVDIDGPVDAKRKRALIAAWRLPVGQPFRQEDWSEAKQEVLSGLLAVAHADARLVDSAAKIEANARQARLTARYDAGPPYRFGGLDVTGLYRYPASLVARYNRVVEPGKPYREEDLAALQSALAATPHFASARVTLDRDGAIPGEDGALIAPVRVAVRERAAHRLDFGAGVSSNTGARVEAGYHTPNLFGQAWNLDSGLRFEQKRQTAYADVTLPPDERNRRHALGLMAEASDIQGLRTWRHAVGVQTTQPRGRVEQRLSLNWERERLRPEGEDVRTSQALAANASWTWRHVDDPLDPRQGIVLQAEIGGGSRALLSDQDFVRLHTRWLYYVPL
ncbi:MAG: BamA/TamA family outer membrane protein, partial [Candidatus Accumulibacter sp.]|nr:BamA/TamA family outer membrane protein [Accumulibacter sp.]